MIEYLYFLSDSFQTISLKKVIRYGYRGNANSLHLTGFLPDRFLFLLLSAPLSIETLCFYKNLLYCRKGPMDFRGLHKVSINFSPVTLTSLSLHLLQTLNQRGSKRNLFFSLLNNVFQIRNLNSSRL